MTEENGITEIRPAETPSDRSPAVIAREINYIKTQTSGLLNAAMAQANRSCFEIGKRLCEVKEIIGHGNWGDWLENNVSYSESTAQNLMKIYKEYGDEQIDMLTGKSKLEIFEKLNYSQMVAMFSLPEPERAEFVENHDMESLSTRDIQKLIREKQEAEERAEEAEREAERRIAEVKQLAGKQAEKAVDDAEKKAAELARKASEEALKAARKKAEEAEKAAKAETEKVKKAQAEKEKAEKELSQLRLQMDTAKKAEPSEETVRSIREEAEQKEKQEAETVLQATLQKEREKDAARQNPNALEINLLFGQLQVNVQQMSEKLKALKKENPEAGQKTAEKIRKGIDSILVTYFGYGVEYEKV